MDDSQYRELKRLILDVGIAVSELKLQMKRMEDAQSHRHQLLYEWCAPASYKAAVDGLSKPLDLPDDLKQFFPG